MKPVALPEIGLDMWEWIVAWHKIGTPVPPPPIVKALTIVLYAKALGTPELVETGTFLGHTLFFLKDHFERLQSIELDPQLHQAACKKFQSFTKSESVTFCIRSLKSYNLLNASFCSWFPSQAVRSRSSSAHEIL